MKTTEQQNQPKNQIIKGTLMTLFAGIAWGMSGASGQYLMAHGMSVLSLTDLRLIISGVHTRATGRLLQGKEELR